MTADNPIADRIVKADEALSNAMMEFQTLKTGANPAHGLIPSQDHLRTVLRWVNNAQDHLRELRWHCREAEKELT